jgi:hypothetical protein
MYYPWNKLPMLKRWLDAADEEDLIVLTSLRLAGGIQKKRLRKRHEQLLFERLRIQKEIENIWKQFDVTKSRAT